MKTPEEIKKGLANAEHVQRMAIVSEDGNCETNYGVLVGYAQRDDIVACIDNLVQRLAQAERERAAAVEDLYPSCELCKYDNRKADEEPCAGCGHGMNWEWRGICEEYSKEDKADEGRT